MMRMDLFQFNKIWLVLAVCVACVLTSADPKPTHHKSRVIDKPPSDQKHYQGEEHNPEYDHEAFAGKEEAKKYDELPPEESKRRLGVLFLKIDGDGDGQVTRDELHAWIKHIHEQNLAEEADNEWKEINPKGDVITWNEYFKYTYGEPEAGEEEEDELSAERDKRRWNLADMNGDQSLTRQEFVYFMHPEEADHMKESVVQDTIDEIDTDHDGFVSMAEYLTDAGDGEHTDDEESDTETGYSKEDEEEFRHELDVNGDGKLDREEVFKWVIPTDYAHMDEETTHLFDEADGDKDGSLSSEEMVENYELFVGSQVTDYGTYLKHQEL